METQRGRPDRRRLSVNQLMASCPWVTWIDELYVVGRRAADRPRQSAWSAFPSLRLGSVWRAVVRRATAVAVGGSTARGAPATAVGPSRRSWVTGWPRGRGPSTGLMPERSSSSRRVAGRVQRRRVQVLEGTLVRTTGSCGGPGPRVPLGRMRERRWRVLGRGRGLFAIEVDDGSGFRAATTAEMDTALRQRAVGRPQQV